MSGWLMLSALPTCLAGSMDNAKDPAERRWVSPNREGREPHLHGLRAVADGDLVPDMTFCNQKLARGKTGLGRLISGDARTVAVGAPRLAIGR